jgi:hypothetical protein
VPDGQEEYVDVHAHESDPDHTHRRSFTPSLIHPIALPSASPTDKLMEFVKEKERKMVKTLSLTPKIIELVVVTDIAAWNALGDGALDKAVEIVNLVKLRYSEQGKRTQPAFPTNVTVVLVGVVSVKEGMDPWYAPEGPQFGVYLQNLNN